MDRRNGEWLEWSQHVLFEIQRLSDGQAKMNDTLVENTKQLEIHIAGVASAREQNDLLREDFEQRLDETEADLTPLKDHVKAVHSIVGFLLKGLGVISVVVGIVIALKTKGAL